MHKPKQGSSAKGLKREYIFDILLYSKNGLFAVAERQEVDLNSNDENMNQKKLSEVDPIAWIQDVYDSVPCGIMRFRVRGNQQELLSANKTALTMSGIESIEMLATIVKMGFFTSSEDADNSLEAYYYELVNIGDTMVIEKSFVNKEGKLRWFRGNNTLLDKKEDERIIQLICYDVTAEKEQEIKEAQERKDAYLDQIFSILSDNTQDAYLLFSLEDFSAEYISPNIERLTGIPIVKFEQEGMDAIRPEGWEPKDSRSAALHVEPGHPLHFDWTRVHRITGEKRLFRDSFYAGELDGARKALLVVSDRTEEVRAQQALEEAVQAANVANMAKSEFLSDMSHDIRTPMNAIIGLINLLEKDIDNKERFYKHLRDLKLSSEHLLELINNVLDMSRIESGKTELDLEEFNIYTLLEEVNSVYRTQAALKGLLVEEEIGIPQKRYEGDSVRVKKVLLNLLSNAVKYTPEGGKIHLSTRSLGIAANGYETLEFKIEDNGYGMSKEFVDIIFQPFAREKNTTISGIGGTGLGMAIVKNLVELMNGNVYVESEPGKGSTFMVQIPFRLISDSEQKPLDEKEIGNVSLNGLKILVVEDYELNAEILMELLGMEGVQCDYAENGKIALERFETSEENRYDMILMDVKMPVMNGYEAATAIRAGSHPRAKTIPIVALTANAFKEDVQHALDAGMNEHIAKPVRIDKIKAAVSRLVKR